MFSNLENKECIVIKGGLYVEFPELQARATALELENTFDILLVIELRPGVTIERIEEMVGVYLDRERVARVQG